MVSPAGGDCMRHDIVLQKDVMVVVIVLRTGEDFASVVWQAWHLLGHGTIASSNQPRPARPAYIVTQPAVGQGRGLSTASYIFSIEKWKGLKLYVAHLRPTHEAHYDSSKSSRSFSSTDKRGDDDQSEACLTARAECNTDPAQ